MNNRVIKNPNFKSSREFHSSLKARGVGAKDFPNTHTEVEHLGGGKFAASIGVGHRVFFDKADGNKPKKHKLTDERPAKDYILIQSAKCCVEVYPHYAKYFDVNHEEIRLHEERWVVQRLFSPPDDWRDVDAYNPVMTVEEYPEPAGDVVKVTVVYDTDYGVLTVEYFQRDGNVLKHNVTFKNTSGGSETFRVVQRWSGIVGDKVNIHGKEHKIITKTTLKGSTFIFGNDALPFKICESIGAIRQEGVKDVLEMLSGSREPVMGEKVLVDRNGLRLTARNIYPSLQLDGKTVMTSDEYELSTIVRAVEDCPKDARVFIGGLGLGVILFPLALSRKAKEVIVCEKDSRVIDVVAPLVENWFGRRYPSLNLTIIQGDAIAEVAKHGNFDWIFMDINIPVPDEYCTPYLTENGKYTDCLNPEIRHVLDRSLYFKSLEVDVHPSGLKADFTYSNWLLAQNESLAIDPDIATLDNPTEDGYIRWEGTAYTRRKTLTDLNFGGTGKYGEWTEDYRAYVEWDISSLAGVTLTANPVFKYNGETSVATDEEINPITEEQPSDADCTDTELWGYIASGTAYVDPFNHEMGTGKQVDLGSSAKTDLQSALDASQSWFAIGFQSPADEGATEYRFDVIFSEEQVDVDPPPTLYVEYSVGWTGKISGVTNPAKIMGVDVANIAKVKGVASA